MSHKSRTAESIGWDKLEDRIKYQFCDRKRLIQAFTRKAHAKEREEESERMGKGIKFPHQDTFRVLGDAVLKAALVDMLLKNEDLDTRGKITEEKKQYESMEGLHKMAKELEIADFIRLRKEDCQLDAECRSPI